MLVLSLPAFENKKKYTANDRFHGNGPYGEIPTKREPIRMLGFTLPYNKVASSKKHTQFKMSAKTIPYLGPKWPKSITYFMTKTAENHTCGGGTYLYSPYEGVPPGGIYPVQGFRLSIRLLYTLL